MVYFTLINTILLTIACLKIYIYIKKCIKYLDVVNHIIENRNETDHAPVVRQFVRNNLEIFKDNEQ